MKHLSKESLAKIATILLVLTSLFLTLSIGLGAYFLYKKGEIKQLKANLVSQQELMNELFKSSPRDHAVFPHTVKDIGFVLNPYLKESSWKAPEGESYRINSLGLRGEEIRFKKKGTTRVLLVGDSMLFGWKLKTEDTLAAIMRNYCTATFGREKYEFIPVAVPGWNIKSETAFLEHHMSRLAPDFIIWSIIPNDGADLAGAIPPGILASWNSPQKTGQVAFTVNRKFKTLLMPGMFKKWEENIRLLQSFSSSHNIPTLFVHWSPHHRAFFEFLFQRFKFKRYPVLTPPPALLKAGPWRVAPGDGHPSAWANRQMAAGLLGKLVELGVISQIKFKPEELETLELFKKEEQEKNRGDAGLEEFVQSKTEHIPYKYLDGDDGSAACILLGIQKGKMLKNGIIYLRSPGKARALNIELETPPHPHQKRHVRFTVKNLYAEENGITVEINQRLSGCTLELPQNKDAPPVYQLSWDFDYSICTGPAFCYSGKLLKAEFLH